MELTGKVFKLQPTSFINSLAQILFSSCQICNYLILAHKHIYKQT